MLANQPNGIHSSSQSSSCFKLSTDGDEAPLIIRMQPLASAVYYGATLVHNCGIYDFNVSLNPFKNHFIFPTSPPGKRESLYLTEGGREAFDHLYQLCEAQMRVVSTSTPSPLIPLPLDSQAQLVSDLLNVLIGVASPTFPLNQVGGAFLDSSKPVCVRLKDIHVL